MTWDRLGLIFEPTRDVGWAASHATAPTPLKIKEGVWRVFYSSRDLENRSHVGWFDINLDDPHRLIGVSNQPILSPGPVGNFDGNGIYTTSVIPISDVRIRFYTIGWNPGHKSPLFYASIGVAESNDRGLTVDYRSLVPIMDRSKFDPTSVTGPWVIRDNDKYKMWYVSGLRWESEAENLKSVYHVKYAESMDGLSWDRRGVVAIDFANAKELNIARPCVVRNIGSYEAWFSHSSGDGYRIGYATSKDGRQFVRKSESVFLPSSAKFESEAVCHPAVVVHKGKRFMFYNGNQFGRDGVALAVES